MTMTYAEALGKNSITVPAHLEADAEVPVITGVQFQGDVGIIPLGLAYNPGEQVPQWPHGETVPDEGIQLIHGEATGNTHWLHAGFASPGVRFHRAGTGLVIGVVTVPPGESAVVVHTDEHGANGIGPGVYELRRKREQRHEEIAYVAD